MQLKPMRKSLILASAFLCALLLSRQSVAYVVEVARARELPTSSQKSLQYLFGMQLKKLKVAPLKTAKKVSPLTASTTHTAANAQAVSALLPTVDKPDIRQNHKVIADSVLRSIPKGCRENVRNFYVRYEKPERRGLGGKTTIILDGTVPDEEFAALLVHECGHVIHSNMMGSATSGQSEFYDGKIPFYNDSPIVAFFAISWDNESVLRRGATKKDFVSGYAKSDSFEDFAETFAMYILHRDALQAQAKGNAAITAKLRWMENNLPASITLSDSDFAWKGSAPWDVTKLGFSWQG